MSKKLYYYKKGGENNIPESYRVSLSPQTKHGFSMISNEEYVSIEKGGKVLYSTDREWYIDSSGILWKIGTYAYIDGFEVFPALHIPRGIIKLWGDKNELQEYLEKQESIKKKKESEYEKKQESLKDLSFSFYTPRMIVKEIIKPTKKVSISVGDIIHGEIKVIEGGIGFLRGAEYANYVDVYINGTLGNRLSMPSFQGLFRENLRVEILGYSYLEP